MKINARAITAAVALHMLAAPLLSSGRTITAIYMAELTMKP